MGRRFSTVLNNPTPGIPFRTHLHHPLHQYVWCEAFALFVDRLQIWKRQVTTQILKGKAWIRVALHRQHRSNGSTPGLRVRRVCLLITLILDQCNILIQLRSYKWLINNIDTEELQIQFLVSVTSSADNWWGKWLCWSKLLISCGASNDGYESTRGELRHFSFTPLPPQWSYVYNCSFI